MEQGYEANNSFPAAVGLSCRDAPEKAMEDSLKKCAIHTRTFFGKVRNAGKTFSEAENSTQQPESSKVFAKLLESKFQEDPDEALPLPKPIPKHPLENAWTLWYKEFDARKSWAEMHHEIMTFQTVEDFWSLYTHLVSPSQLKYGNDFALFKKGIPPMWENEKNKEGGCWIIAWSKTSKKNMDELWLDVLLSLIGETFDGSYIICGAVIKVRKVAKISIWTESGTDLNIIKEIEERLRKILNISKSHINFYLHKDLFPK